MDVAGATFGLLVFSPAWAAIATLITLQDGGPVLYRGRRVGRFGAPFEMLKFRTMVVHAERLGGPSTAGDDPRVTPLGVRNV